MPLLLTPVTNGPPGPAGPTGPQGPQGPAGSGGVLNWTAAPITNGALELNAFNRVDLSGGATLTIPAASDGDEIWFVEISGAGLDSTLTPSSGQIQTFAASFSSDITIFEGSANLAVLHWKYDASSDGYPGTPAWRLLAVYVPVGG